MSKAVNISSSYLADALERPQKLIEQAEWDLRFIEFDTIVCRGLSGLLIAPQVAQKLRKRLLVVRKESRQTHGNPHAEGSLGERWIFLDDFKSLGGTFRACEDVVKKVSFYAHGNPNFFPLYIGSYEYSFRRWTFNQDLAPSEPDKPYRYMTNPDGGPAQFAGPEVPRLLL